MTPKEKAKELCLKFQHKLFINLSYEQEDADYIHNDSKECALIAVDEILNNFGLTANGQTFFTEHRAVKYYQEVKQEIEEL